MNIFLTINKEEIEDKLIEKRQGGWERGGGIKGIGLSTQSGR